jgi:hypothetical protein
VIDTFTCPNLATDLTKIYQRLPPKLHFDVSNFQQYASINQGAVFLLLHFWFHALIVLLHRPTLLIAFEGRIQQLFPNSRELSMSLAKTIADILAFAELVDSKAVKWESVHQPAHLHCRMCLLASPFFVEPNLAAVVAAAFGIVAFLQ